MRPTGQPLPYHGGPAIAATALQRNEAAALREIESSSQAVATGTFGTSGTH